MQPDSSAPEEMEQPTPSAVQEPEQPAPSTLQGLEQPDSPSTKNNKVRNRPRTIIIFLALLSFLLLASLVAAGLWASKLNAQLTSTQQQLTALQGENSKLQADYAKLISDKEKVAADLDQANTDLKNSKDQNENLNAKTDTLNAKLDKAGKMTEVLYSFATVKTATDFLKIDALIKATNDSQLSKLWGDFTDAPTAAGSEQVLIYVINAIRNGLK